MDVFTFLSIWLVAAIVGKGWKEYLGHRRAESGGVDPQRLEALERRVAALEGAAPGLAGGDLDERLRVLEAIVVDGDVELEQELAALAEESK